MAGEWIKLRTNLWDDPRVARLCDLTDQAEATVVGGLYWLWAMADDHSEDGFLPGLTARTIDRKTGVKGLGDGLASIGWIAFSDEGVEIINFSEHNGQSAKRRCLEAKRKAASRKVSASDADKNGTPCGAREDKNNINPSHTPRGEDSPPVPDPTPAVAPESPPAPTGPQVLDLEWQPDPQLLAAYARRSGVAVEQITPEAVGPFVVHHQAKGTLKTHAEHVAALVAWVKRDLVRDQRVVPLAGRRAATAGADFDDSATGWLG